MAAVRFHQLLKELATEHERAVRAAALGQGIGGTAPKDALREECADASAKRVSGITFDEGTGHSFNIDLGRVIEDEDGADNRNQSKSTTMSVQSPSKVHIEDGVNTRMAPAVSKLLEEDDQAGDGWIHAGSLVRSESMESRSPKSYHSGPIRTSSSDKRSSKLCPRRTLEAPNVDAIEIAQQFVLPTSASKPSGQETTPPSWRASVSSGSVFSRPSFASFDNEASVIQSLRAEMKRKFHAKLVLSTKGCNGELCFRMWADLAKSRIPVIFSSRDVWEGKADEDFNTTSCQIGMHVARHAERGHVSVVHAQIHVDSCVLEPSGDFRIAWDFFGGLLLLYDTLVIPLSAFNLEETAILTSMAWIARIFWTLDMVVSCFTGFVRHGKTIMQRWEILKHYVLTWFIFDLVMVSLDWLGVMTTKRTERAELLFRIIRVLRVTRLLRIVKIRRILAKVKDRIDSEWMFILTSVVKVVLILLFINHMTGCSWYAVGAAARGYGSPNWLDDNRLTGRSLAYRYATSIHWSFAQFTPATTEVHPHNLAERCTAILVLILGLLVFSSFVSGMVTSVTQLRNMSEDMEKQLWLLRRFLRQRKIDHGLSYRILRHVEYACQVQKEHVTESNIRLLALLSDQLREELCFAVTFKSVIMQPFLACAHRTSALTMHRLARVALAQRALANNDTLFLPGMLTTHMYVVASGVMRYQTMTEIVVGPGGTSAMLEENDWASEAALWTSWVHLGAALATTEVDLVTVEVDAFAQVFSGDAVTWELASDYAQYFLEMLSSIPRGDLTDVGLHGEDHAFHGFFEKHGKPGNYTYASESRHSRSSEQGWKCSSTLGSTNTVGVNQSMEVNYEETHSEPRKLAALQGNMRQSRLAQLQMSTFLQSFASNIASRRSGGKRNSAGSVASVVPISG